MYRWTIALAASLLLASACGSSRPAAGPATSGGGPAPTTETTAADTSGRSGTTDTAADSGAAGRWDTPCRELRGTTAGAGLSYDGVSDRFGPLGPAPLLDVVLPTVAAAGPDDDRQVQAQAARVNGGVVVSVTADRGQPDDASVVAVVDRDGARRWVRCLPGTVLDVWVAAPRLQPATALVLLFPPGGTSTAQWSLLALDSGETVPGFAQGAAAAGLDAGALADALVASESPSSVLLRSHSTDSNGGVTTGPVARYDLVSGAFTAIPPPPDGFGDGDLALGQGDDVVLSSYSQPGVTAVFHDGAWRTDDASREASGPDRVWFASGEANGGVGPRPLQAVDGAGRVRWQNAELTDPSMEGTMVITDGAVTVANVCTADAAAGGCDRFETVGVDTTTGAVRWRLPGFRGVAAAADGWALLSDNGLVGDDNGTPATGWMLVDDRSGAAAAPDQRWSGADAFARGCCGDIERWVERVGGAVLAGAPGHLRVWYPPTTDGSPVTASLL